MLEREVEKSCQSIFQSMKVPNVQIQSNSWESSLLRSSLAISNISSNRTFYSLCFPFSQGPSYERLMSTFLTVLYFDVFFSEVPLGY